MSLEKALIIQMKIANHASQELFSISLLKFSTMKLMLKHFLTFIPAQRFISNFFSANFSVAKSFKLKKSGLIESARDECGDQATDWLTDWSWACIGRHAFNRFLSLTGKNDQPGFVLPRLLKG